MARKKPIPRSARKAINRGTLTSRNTDKVKNEMLVYEVDNKTVIDIQHLVQSQVATINNQAKVIKLLEENNNLKDQIKRLSDDIDALQEEIHGQPQY